MIDRVWPLLKPAGQLLAWLFLWKLVRIRTVKSLWGCYVTEGWLSLLTSHLLILALSICGPLKDANFLHVWHILNFIFFIRIAPENSFIYVVLSKWRLQSSRVSLLGGLLSRFQLSLAVRHRLMVCYQTGLIGSLLSCWLCTRWWRNTVFVIYCLAHSRHLSKCGILASSHSTHVYPVPALHLRLPT